MNDQEIYFWRAGLSDEPLEEEREAMKNITPRLTAEQILGREARFVERGMAGYETLRELRREWNREAERERRWRKVKRWAKRLAFGLAIVGVGYVAVWASLR